MNTRRIKVTQVAKGDTVRALAWGKQRFFRVDRVAVDRANTISFYCTDLQDRKADILTFPINNARITYVV